MKSFLQTLLLVLPLSACFGTETGNPPLQPELSSALIFADEVDGRMLTMGAPGAVSPGGVELQFTDIAGIALPERIVVEDDGSFLIETPLVDRLRLQAIDGPRRSGVVDLSLLFDTASSDCRPIVPEPYLRLEGAPGVESVLRFRARSVCGDPLTPTLRLGDQGLSVSGAMLPSGELEVTLRFDGRPGEVEDVIALSAGRGIDWITVVAESCGDACL